MNRGNKNQALRPAFRRNRTRPGGRFQPDQVSEDSRALRCPSSDPSLGLGPIGKVRRAFLHPLLGVTERLCVPRGGFKFALIRRQVGPKRLHGDYLLSARHFFERKSDWHGVTVALPQTLSRSTGIRTKSTVDLERRSWRGGLWCENLSETLRLGPPAGNAATDGAIFRLKARRRTAESADKAIRHR
jgi:hypothetical protein